MILHGRFEGRLSWQRRVALIILALALLPLSARRLSGEAPRDTKLATGKVEPAEKVQAPTVFEITITSNGKSSDVRSPS